MSRLVRRIILAIGLASASCMAPSARWGAQPVILTNKHVKGLNLTKADLEQLQVYLGSSLSIKGKRVEMKNRISRSHALDVEQTNRVEEVKFWQGIPGRVVNVYKDWFDRFNPFNRTMKLMVSFERNKKMLFLEFEPDANGNYRLVLDSGKVKYGGRQYTCLQGCSDNYLRVSANVIRKWKHKHRIARGWPF